MTTEGWIIVLLCAVIFGLLFLHLRLESRVAGIEWRSRAVRSQLQSLEEEHLRQRRARSFRQRRRR